MYQAAQGRAQPLFVRAYDRAGACVGVAALGRLYGFVRESLQRRGVAWRAPEGQAELVKDLLLDPGRALLAVSYWDGEPINAALFGLFAGKAYYLSGGSSLVGNSKYGPA